MECCKMNDIIHARSEGKKIHVDFNEKLKTIGYNAKALACYVVFLHILHYLSIMKNGPKFFTKMQIKFGINS